MARIKDPDKRELILSAARTLFADRGFHNTSMADLKKACGLPVGSLYTYFSSKEAILDTIINEGWTQLILDLEKQLSDASSLQQRISLLVDNFLPRLLDEADLVRIILAEAIEISGLPEKLDRLVGMVLSLRGNLPSSPGMEYIRTAIVVYFLGIMGANSLVDQPKLGIGRRQIMEFVRQTMENELGVASDREPGPELA